MDWKSIRDSQITPAIRDVGVLFILHRSSNVDVDPVAGAVNSNIDIAIPCYGVIQNIDIKLVPAKYVTEKAEQIMLEATALVPIGEPKNGDVLVSPSGEALQVSFVRPKRPGGIDLNYLVVVNR